MLLFGEKGCRESTSRLIRAQSRREVRMASRGGGRSPGATAVGRGRARERAKSALSLLPVRPGASRTLPPQSPEAGTTVAPPAPGDVAGAGGNFLYIDSYALLSMVYILLGVAT